MELPTRIEVESGERVVFEWPDGDRQQLSAKELRESCPCAGCREQMSAGVAVLTDAAAVRITAAELVGDYAINFVFEPGNHHTGIYSFDLLRAIGK